MGQLGLVQRVEEIIVSGLHSEFILGLGLGIVSEELGRRLSAIWTVMVISGALSLSPKFCHLVVAGFESGVREKTSPIC